jgi:hypothetical protein
MIPIETDGGFFLNPLKARSFGESLSQKYTSAAPYPHIAIDDFLPNEFAEEILNNFPYESQKNAAEYALNYAGIQKNKRQVFPNDWVTTKYQKKAAIEGRTSVIFNLTHTCQNS